MKSSTNSLVAAIAVFAAPLCGRGQVMDISRADFAGLSFDPVAMVEAAQLFQEGQKVYANVTARMRRHAAELAKKGIAEVPASTEAVRYRIDTGPFGKMLVDDWGEIYIDRRFLTNEELATVKRIEDFVWEHVITPMQQAKVLPPGQRQGGGVKPVPASAKTPLRKRAPRIHAGGAGLPVFRGFEDARYQQHDALIAKMVADFNADKAKWCGGTASQAAKIKDLTAAQVKSHMIEESGGNGPRSKAAWAVDPIQVNVPGDWGREKELVGLRQPSKRNEGTVEQNVRAAIMYLSRKGFGASGRPAAERPKGFFDGWLKACQRYNGRRDRTETDRWYSDEYADKIMKRAENPDTFVPIEIKLKK